MQGKKIVILQSNYIPWKGYFDAMALVDEFVLYDDVQYTRRDWRNRNLIKTPTGLQWLTIPLQVKGHYRSKIRDMRVADRSWSKKHLHAIRHNYAKAGYYKDLFPFLEKIYEAAQGMEYITDINYLFLTTIKDYLGIATPLKYSHEYEYRSSDKNMRLIEICMAAGAKYYYTGPAAKAYIDVGLFQKYGIEVRWLDYSGYPEYPQLYPPFRHEVSIIDLLLNCGLESWRYLKHTHKSQV